MFCPSGKYASKIGAISDTDGCDACALGFYSMGSNVTSCSDIECPIGKYSTLVDGGAINISSGCINCVAG